MHIRSSSSASAARRHPLEKAASAVVVALALQCGVFPSLAAPLQRAEITAVINEVSVVDPQRGARQASIQDVVQGQTAVKTGVKSRSELLFQDKTLTRLGANTLFSFDQGTRELELSYGTMLLQAPKGKGGGKIRTAAVTAAITGTTIMIEYSPVKWNRLQPPGVSTAVADMTPEQCCKALENLKMAYSKADLAELRRKCALARKASGHVKVMVLEGTLRLYLNNRTGESVLINAGQMVVLSPNATTIPPGVDFDIARLATTSLLVNNKFWPTGDLNMVAINSEIEEQKRERAAGNLIDTNLLIYGGGTQVSLALTEQTQSQGITSNPVLVAAAQRQAAPLVAEEDAGADNPPPVPPDNGGAGGGNNGGGGDGNVVPELPKFTVEGGAEVALAGEAPPASSKVLGGNFATVTSLPLNPEPGDIAVLPTEGSDFAVFSNAGSIDDGTRDLTITKVTRTLDISAGGGKVGLGFDYRFLTDEIDQGASVPDQFNVVVSSGTESIVLALDRDALSIGGTGILTPVAQAGVGGFEGGTDWLPFQIDLAPFKGKTTTISFIIWDVGDSVVDSAFAVDDFRLGSSSAAPGPAAIPGKLTLNLNTVKLGSAQGEFTVPNMEGLPARNNSGPAANAGSLVVNTTSDLTVAVNGAINASTGANGAGTTYGGRGGSVTLSSATGEVEVNSPIKVSESSSAAGKASAAAGSIRITSNKTAGPAITINNTGELLALLNAAAPGPGGRIDISSVGGDIVVNGAKLTADRGVIDVRTNGPGMVQINAAQLAADAIKIGALGTNGQLTITAGSQLSADSTLKLYGGSGALGRVLFNGSGTVELRGNPIQIAGKTVEISNATHVNNTGPTNVHADNAIYGVGAGGGNFRNAVNAGPLSGAPSFD